MYTLSMLSNNQINEIPVKKVCERINCPKCNKPNMSKKNISAHYKAGCSGVWDQYDQKKIKDAPLEQMAKPSPKEPKEKKPRQPRKPRNKKLSFSCSDFIDFTNWLIENQIILDGEDQDHFQECYQQFKNNQEPPKPPMIIKINLPFFNFKEKEDTSSAQIPEVSVEEVVEESVQFGDIYPEEESFKNENEMIKKDGDNEDDEEAREYEEYMRIEREKYDLENGIKEEVIQEIIKPLPIQEVRISKPVKLSTLRKPRKEKQVTEFIIPADSWLLKSHKKVIDPEDEFFLEDENIENEYPNNNEEEIELKLNKFMERFGDKEIKNYSNDQKNRIGNIIRNEKKVLHGINYMTNIELYKNKYQYNFILRNLINLIKVKLDQLEDQGLSQEESLKKFNEFDKTKFIKKYNDKFNHWADRAINTYQNPKGYEWTITTRDAPLEQMA